jgi:hypothetical protein
MFLCLSVKKGLSFSAIKIPASSLMRYITLRRTLRAVYYGIISPYNACRTEIPTAAAARIYCALIAPTLAAHEF